jgi:hypothetical protein
MSTRASIDSHTDFVRNSAARIVQGLLELQRLRVEVLRAERRQKSGQTPEQHLSRKRSSRFNAARGDSHRP